MYVVLKYLILYLIHIPIYFVHIVNSNPLFSGWGNIYLSIYLFIQSSTLGINHPFFLPLLFCPFFFAIFFFAISFLLVAPWIFNKLNSNSRDKKTENRRRHPTQRQSPRRAGTPSQPKVRAARRDWPQWLAAPTESRSCQRAAVELCCR